jgi:hypothetical protein
MAIVIDEVLTQVDPEPTPRRDAPATPTRDSGADIVRAQIALLARRAARLRAD